MIEYGIEIEPGGGHRARQIIAHFKTMDMVGLRAIEEHARSKGDTYIANAAKGEMDERNRYQVPWVFDDGGRSKYFKGKNAGDCVTRSIVIAGEFDYKKVYDDLAALNKNFKGKKSARDGISHKVYRPYFSFDLGWEWTPTMEVGSGCQVHLRPDELPEGRLVVRLSGHLAAVIDGVLHDTYDCSRNGTRCVYGYWTVSD